MKNQHQGEERKTLILGALFFLIAITAAVMNLSAEVHRLPVANFDGWETFVVVNNPTSESIERSTRVSPETGWQPYSTERQTFGSDGGGIEAFEADGRLDVYAEVRDPFGQLVWIRDVGDGNEGQVQIQDLRSFGDFATYLFLYSETRAALHIEWFVDAEPIGYEWVYLEPGEAQLPRTPAPANRVVITPREVFSYPLALYDAFALVSQQPRGQLDVIYPVAIE